MPSKDKSPRIAIGFRVKTGRATAIVMAGPASAPRALSRKNLQLLQLRSEDPTLEEIYLKYFREA